MSYNDYSTMYDTDSFDEAAKHADQKEGTRIFSKDDERIWKPDYKKSGIYQIVFLPFIDLTKKENIFTGSFSTHSVRFRDPETNKDGVLFGICPKTKGKDERCVICDYGWDGWKEASKATKEHKKNFLPSQSEYVNVLVVKDPITPENNGKVFMYRLPASIKKMIAERMNPTEANLKDDDFVAFNPYNPARTSKFKLYVDINENASSNKERCDYKRSAFIARKKEELAPIGESKEEIGQILSQCYDLKTCIDEHVEQKMITKETIDRFPIVKKAIAGEITSVGTEGMSSIPGGSQGSVDVNDVPNDSISAEDEDFLKNI
jgi:hypothetical protein